MNLKKLTKKVPFYRHYKVFFFIQLSNSRHGEMAFVYRLEELIAEHGVRLFKSQHPEMVDELQYPYTFCLFGCIGMIKKWLDEDSDQTVEEMAAITDNLLRGVKNACV